MFLLPVSSQKSSKNSSKTVKNRLPDTSDNFSLVFPGPDPQKRENTSRIKDFGGGSAAGARPPKLKLAASYGAIRRTSPDIYIYMYIYIYVYIYYILYIIYIYIVELRTLAML